MTYGKPTVVAALIMMQVRATERSYVHVTDIEAYTIKAVAHTETLLQEIASKRQLQDIFVEQLARMDYVAHRQFDLFPEEIQDGNQDEEAGTARSPGASG